MIARADVIVRGNVDNVIALNPDDSYMRFHQVTVTTRNRIAGECADRVRFVTTHEEPYVNLEKADHEGLFFLIQSQLDFNRRINDYFYSRCPWRCKNVVNLDDENVSVTSLNATGLSQVRGSHAILAKVEQYLRTLQRDRQLRGYGLREPDKRAFTGYDSFLSVPIDQNLHSVAKRWSTGGGLKARIAKETGNSFVRLIEFEAAATKYAAEHQAPTDWHHANTLSIDSLEWMASDSDVIVRGTIEDLVLVQLGDRENTDDYEQTLDRHLVKFRVTEPMKGECEKMVSFVIENGGRLSQWKERKTPLLVFLKDRMLPIWDSSGRPLATRVRVPLRYAGRGTDTKAVIAFEEGHPKVFSTRLAWTDDPHEMLAIVRTYLAQVPGARASRSRNSRSVSFEPPEIYLKGTAWEGDQYVRMKFPIDTYLEKQARRWIISERKEDRWLGAYSLVYFKSDKNAEALERLLVDPGKWPKPILVSIYSHLEVTYLVRWEAWTILHAWGYDIPKPRFNDI